MPLTNHTSLNLDTARRKYDQGGMLASVAALGAQFHEGWVAAADLEPRHRANDIDHIVVLGMGGSAIGGDLLRAYTRAASPLPVTVVRDYVIPAWVGEQTLVVASSYSGTTEETLSAVEMAREAGAPLYAVTSGGSLLDLARGADLPHVVLPGGMQPRAALGYSFAALLRIADKVGAIKVDERHLEEVLELLGRNAESLARDDGRAADIARALQGRVAVVYTGSGILEPVGVRWRNQIHENAKQPAFGNAFAELTHNEIMGWQNAPEVFRQRVAAVVLRDGGDHPKVRRRIELTARLVGTRLGNWIEHDSEGESPLARMLSTIQLGDYVSVHLALLDGVDPTPVDTIEKLKKMLAA